MKTCGKCGWSNSDDVYICAICGSPLKLFAYRHEAPSRVLNQEPPRAGGFWHAVGLGFRGYFNFGGTATREDFNSWLYFRIGVVSSFFVWIGLLAIDFLPAKVYEALFCVWLVADVVTILPTFSVHVRRLHAKERSGFWALPAAILFAIYRLLWLVPLLNGSESLFAALFVIIFLSTVSVLAALAWYCSCD